MVMMVRTAPSAYCVIHTNHEETFMACFILRLCLAGWLILLTSGSSAAATTATVLPIRLDYPLLRAFFVNQAFTDPGETAVVIDESSGCHFLQLRSPEIFSESGELRLKAKVKLRMGLSVLETCQLPIELEGYADVRLNVTFDVSGWALRFAADDLRFTSLDGRPAMVAAQVVELVRARLFGHLDQVTLNLSTPVRELRQMLPLFFEVEAQPRISQWLQSIRPGKIEARPQFYSIELLMDVETEQAAAAPAPAEQGLSADELARFRRSFEALDAFMVYQIDRLGAFGLEAQERADLLQTLLASRYQLVAALASGQQVPGQDMVREQFVTAWEQFSPLFRKYLAQDPSVAPLSFLVYLSAGDALAALDQLGPTLGLEISRDGLIRLVRLLNDAGRAGDLDYSYEVDPVLRTRLGFGPPLAVPEQVFPGEEVDVETLNGEGIEPEKVLLLHPGTWFDFSPRAAVAAELPPTNRQALKPWLVDASNFDAYQQMVRSLLQEEVKQAVTSGKLPAERRDLFEKIMQAAAWQESCFRQFTVKQGKMSYLRSWNNTSVGLMQINERVWRGLYRVDALRWDPKYNIQAGSEILRMYLSDYVLQKNPGRLFDEEGQARATYALYNSGPQNFKGFVARHAKRDYFKSDTLFWEKYGWAKAGEFDRLRGCLFAE